MRVPLTVPADWRCKLQWPELPSGKGRSWMTVTDGTTKACRHEGKLKALVYDIFPSRKMPESDARSLARKVAATEIFSARQRTTLRRDHRLTYYAVTTDLRTTLRCYHRLTYTNNVKLSAFLFSWRQYPRFSGNEWRM